LPLPRALLPRARRVSQPYRLPPAVKDRLTSALARFRNREAAYTLAVFLGRFWSMPGRVALPFPIDRRALADRQDLGLTEAQVRGAIRVLELVGFLDRALVSGSRYKPTEHGLRRKPIPFTFGSEYAPLFIAANGGAAAARGGQERARRSQTPDNRKRASAGSAGAQKNTVGTGPIFPRPNSPKGRSEAERSLLMGEVRIGIPPKAFVPDANLDAALEQLQQGVFGIAESKRGGRGQ
jgi:hypothetical protein